MNENNTTLAELTRDAVRQTADEVAQKIMDIVEDAERDMVTLKKSAEDLVKEIRKHAGLMSDSVTHHVERCQNIADALHSIRGKFFEPAPDSATTTTEVPLNRDMKNIMHSLTRPMNERT